MRERRYELRRKSFRASLSWRVHGARERGAEGGEKFLDNHRGYVLCTVTPQRWTTDFRAIQTHTGDPDAPVSTLETFVVEDGAPGAQRA